MEGQSLIAPSYLLLTCISFSFRWVYCQLDMLRHCFPPSVRRVLDELPEALDGTYERILMEIKLPNRNQAHHLFQCLAVAIRPLRVEEVAEVLAVDFDTDGATPKLNVHRRWEDPEQAVLSACSSLVTIVDIDGSRVVNFTHFSVLEFLTSSRLATSSGRVSSYHISFEPAHTILAQACLSVLLVLDLNNIGHFPFAEYAAKHWVDHARFEDVTSHIQKEMELLFDPENPHFANWVSVYNVDEPSGSPPLPHPTRPNAAPLYYAALCGFESLVKRLMRPMNVDARGGHHERAIQAALYKGHLSIVRLLIDCGADIYSLDVKGSSLLHIAAQTGDPEAVSLLIECGADVNARDGERSTALHIASGNEHLDVVQFLLDRGAEVSPKDNHGSTPLHLASAKGNNTIAGLLMDHGADLGALDNAGSTPLNLASAHGNFAAVQFLLDHGAMIHIQDNCGSTPLHLASAMGYNAVARLLMEHGADPSVMDNTGSTPLHLASVHGNFDVVQSLLDHGAEIHPLDKHGSTPLHLASAKGNNTIAGLLMDRGADLGALDNTGSTPLHLASAHGNFDVVDVLIRRGASVDACDSKNSTPLHLASTMGNRTVVRSLLEHGANMVTPGEKGNTPLHVASRHGSFDVVKLLLERGAQPNAQNDEGRTPLHIASQEGAVDVVQCLLAAGANVNVRDHSDKTPRDVTSNNSKVVRLLTGHARPNKRRDSRNRILSQLQTAAIREGRPSQATPELEKCRLCLCLGPRHEWARLGHAGFCSERHKWQW
jgi:ankyrin repeat protein